MSAPLSEFDRRLLDALQRSVPLVPRPFEPLARELSTGETGVIDAVSRLSGPGGIIREISAVLEAASLGYATTLVAARVPSGGLDRAGEVVAAHPGVSHAYARDGRPNLWFTLSVGPDSDLGLGRTIDVLGRLMGADEAISLPARRRYKLHARFDLSGGREPRPEGSGGVGEHEEARSLPVAAGASGPPTDEQVRAIRALQTPLPALREPFLGLAREAGMSVEALLVHGADFVSAGWMRRYAAVLRHRQAGAAFNVLVAWQVPPAKADAFGAQAAGFGAVSHCYLRQAAPGWPYNLYTMVHAPGPASAARTIEAIAAAGGDWPRATLPTAREYAKARVRLFTPAVRQWESTVVD